MFLWYQLFSPLGSVSIDTSLAQKSYTLSNSWSYTYIATAGGMFRLHYLYQTRFWNTGGWQDEFLSLPPAKDHSV